MPNRQQEYRYLHPGDEVALVAPASHMRRGTEWMIDSAVNLLESWDLRVQTRCATNRKKFYLAGDDEYRAQQLIAAVNDRNVSAIFGTRGGYGSTRLLPYLRRETAHTEKLFCGFSDLTALLFAFQSMEPMIHSVHGPHLATEQFLGDTTEAAQNRSQLHALLFSREMPPPHKIHPILPGLATAPLVGGCLSVIVTLLGTPFEPNFDGKLVFLEDVGEKPFRIDRMLTHLLIAGKFDNVRGIVFGDMKGCGDNPKELSEVIRYVFRTVGIPVAIDMKAGHGKLNFPFRFGQRAALDNDEGTLTFT